MVEPISTGVAVFGVGAGAWLLDKVLGRSAEAIGDALRVYVSDRVSKIFSRAAEIADSSPTVNVEPLPPAFLLKFFQESSFSEDHDSITEMWANILVNTDGALSSRLSFFSSILSRLGHREVILLEKFFIGDETLKKDAVDFSRSTGAERASFGWTLCNEIANGREQISVPVSEYLDTFTEKFEANSNLGADCYRSMAWNIRNIVCSTMVIESVRLRTHLDFHFDEHDYGIQSRNGSIEITSMDSELLELAVSLDILKSLGILEKSKVEVANASVNAEVTVYMPTPMGIEFMFACGGFATRGRPNP